MTEQPADRGGLVASIQRYTWNRGKPDAIPGVIIRSGRHRTFIPKGQLATFADYMIDTLEEAEQG